MVISTLAMTVSDIILDLLSVFVFHGGLFGIGLASGLSYLVAFILESIDRLDAAAEKKTEDIEKLHPAKTQDELWILKKHRYEGWS